MVSFCLIFTDLSEGTRKYICEYLHSLSTCKYPYPHGYPYSSHPYSWTPVLVQVQVYSVALEVPVLASTGTCADVIVLFPGCIWREIDNLKTRVQKRQETGLYTSQD